MAYDNIGATVGAAGHDAATLVAALISSGGVQGEENIFATFASLRNAILADSLVVQAENASTPSAAPARSSYSGGSGKSAGGPAGADTDIRSGKYAGKTVGEVIAEDSDYAEWAVANLKNDFLRKAFASAMAA